MTMIWKASWNYNEDRYEIDSVDEDGGLGGPKQISSADGEQFAELKILFNAAVAWMKLYKVDKVTKEK